MGYHEDKSLWMYFKTHWSAWFPGLGSRKTFVKQASNLWQVKEKLQKHLAMILGRYAQDIYLVDGFPLLVCHFKRAGFSKISRGESAYEYCASKSEKYYGFKGHLVIGLSGVAVELTVTPANCG